MNFSEIRRWTLKGFLGFLALTAIVAIVSVLSGEFGKLQGKILITCFTISAVSICSMSCAAYIERRRHVKLGLTGIGFAIVSGLLVLVGMWPEIDDEIYWKSTATSILAATTLAYVFLMLIPELDRRQQWVQWSFTICAGILALQIAGAIWMQIESDGYFRALAVVAIIVVLETLAIPIILRLQKGRGQGPQSLVLTPFHGNVYRDADGRHFQLTEIEVDSTSRE